VSYLQPRAALKDFPTAAFNRHLIFQQRHLQLRVAVEVTSFTSSSLLSCATEARVCLTSLPLHRE